MTLPKWEVEINDSGTRFSLADILLFCFLDFAQSERVNQPINPDHKWVQAFYERAKARPSASA